MASTEPTTEGDKPFHAFYLAKPGIQPVASKFSPLQKAILPVVGFAGGAVEPFATAFNISSQLSIALTAWHVVDQFIEDNSAGLEAGTCHLAVVLETNELLPDGRYLGSPVPVLSVTRLVGTDLAVLRMAQLMGGVTPVVPDRLALSFAIPTQGDHCYTFGYPVLMGGPW